MCILVTPDRTGDASESAILKFCEIVLSADSEGVAPARARAAAPVADPAPPHGAISQSSTMHAAVGNAAGKPQSGLQTAAPPESTSVQTAQSNAAGHVEEGVELARDLAHRDTASAPVESTPVAPTVDVAVAVESAGDADANGVAILAGGGGGGDVASAAQVHTYAVRTLHPRVAEVPFNSHNKVSQSRVHSL